MAYIPQVSADPKSLRGGTSSISSALTTSFDTSTVHLRCQNWNQVVLYFNVNLDVATDVRVRIDVATPASSSASGTPMEADPADTDASWYPLAYQDNSSLSVASSVATVSVDVLELKFSTTGTYAYPLPVNYKYLRARAKCNGGPGAATLSITATTGLA